MINMPDPTNSFLRDFVSLGEGTEVPPIFLLWSGIAGISAALERRCWIDQGSYIVYPNIYMILIAGSGRCRKSTAIGLIENLLIKVEPPINILPDSVTREALITALRGLPPSAPPLACPTAVGCAIVDEFMNFLSKKNYESGLGAFLISMFDCKDRYTYSTISRGTEAMKNTCLSIIGGTTVDWVRLAIPMEAIGGGLTSRMTLVYCEEPAPPVSRPKSFDTKKPLIERLIRTLTRIRMLSGQVKLTEAAGERFDVIYNHFYNTSLFFADATSAGYASRRHVHLLKVAMALAASEETLTIDVHHINGANEALLQTEKWLTRVLGLITSSEKGTLLELLQGLITKHKRIPRHELLKLVSHRVDSQELTNLMDTLIHAKRVRAVASGGQIFYEVL